MSVFKLKDGKSRKLPWRAVVPRQGQSRLIKQFATRQEAELWEREHKKRERLKDVPEFQRAVQVQELRQHTVGDLVEHYVEHNQHLSRNNLITLRAFLREDISEKNLLELTRQDVNRFIEKKKHDVWKPPGANGEAKPLSSRTIRRQLNIIQRVFQWSIEFRKGFENLPNHFRGIRIQGSTGGRRERSLEGDELERILEASMGCLGVNKIYVPLAIYLAIDTGMRRQEIFNLTWGDVDIEKRRIQIRKSKTDKVTGSVGATIVLPATARQLLLILFDWEAWWNPDPNERVFPMSDKAFTQAWADVLKRAQISNLHFHDLRREANTRFYKAGLTLEERNFLLRHADKSMNSVYMGRNTVLNGIQDKLDKFVLGGLILAEAEKKFRLVSDNLTPVIDGRFPEGDIPESQRFMSTIQKLHSSKEQRNKRSGL
jgi:integrase